MPGAIGSASGFERIEVVTGFERRRPRGLGEKLKAVEETRLSGISLVRGLAFALDPNL
jgi:transposase